MNENAPAPPVDNPDLFVRGWNLNDITVSEALALLRQSPNGSLPFYQPETGELLGVLSRPSLTPPRLGGMATPLGVYLTDGVHAGGAGFWGLFLTGMTLGSLALAAQAVVFGLGHLLGQAAPHLTPPLRALSPLGPALLTLLLLFAGLRLLPMSGTHAAEHQVVHCIERGAPLLPSWVRAMPRVHPRCGTNLVVGFTLFQLIFLAVFVAAQTWALSALDAATISLVAAAPVALLFWRRLGGWVQQWLATRPATDRQIADAIRAAEQVLRRRSAEASSGGGLRFPRRVWRMGLAQVLLGYAALTGLVMLVAHYWPGLGYVLGV